MHSTKKPNLRALLKPPGRPVLAPLRIPPVPHKKWLASGKQTLRTKAIVKFASKFRGNPAQIAREIVKELSYFARVPLDYATLQHYYSKRTADQIIRSGKIVVGAPDVEEKGPLVWGCIDQCLVLCAVLRAKGIPAVFVREGDHSRVHFFTGEKWMLADTIHNTVRDFESGDFERIQRRKNVLSGKIYYAEGLDAWGIGIKSLDDFAKYSIR